MMFLSLFHELAAVFKHLATNLLPYSVLLTN